MLNDTQAKGALALTGPLVVWKVPLDSCHESVMRLDCATPAVVLFWGSQAVQFCSPVCLHLRLSFLPRFCVAIKKENYPDYMPSNIFSDSAKQIFRQPGHTIYLLPTVVLCNLLPCELEFYVKGVPISGTLKPGKEAALHTADTSQNIELGKDKR